MSERSEVYQLAHALMHSIDLEDPWTVGASVAALRKALEDAGYALGSDDVVLGAAICASYAHGRHEATDRLPEIPDHPDEPCRLHLKLRAATWTQAAEGVKGMIALLSRLTEADARPVRIGLEEPVPISDEAPYGAVSVSGWRTDR